MAIKISTFFPAKALQNWPSKIGPNYNFWFENKPSGNPASDHVQG
jgi:hypothetical protein